MATVPQLLSAVASAAATAIGGSPVRYDSDYREDLEKIHSGVTRFQVRGSSVGDAHDSNTTYQRVAVEVAVHHGLPGAERTYTEGAMQTALSQFLSLAWWRAIAEVFEIDAPPELVVSRIGRVVTYTVAATVLLRP